LIGHRVARRYAKALVDLAEKEGRLDDVGEELGRMVSVLLESEELRLLLLNPAVVRGLKSAMLRELTARLSLSSLVVKFLDLLLQKGRMRDLDGVFRAYRNLADALRNRVRARVRSASVLSPEEEEALKARLSEFTGKEVILEVETDPNLLGGLSTQVGSSVWDGSIRKGLENLRGRILSG
jgi:F-type H+-transporting ATPase subunit delta